MKEEKCNYLIETDASTADEHGEMHDSLEHVCERKIGEIAVGRHRTDARVQTAAHCRDQIAMRHKNSLRKTSGAAGVADGADVVSVGRMVDDTMLVTDVHDLLHGVHGDALGSDRRTEDTCSFATLRVFSSMSPMWMMTFREGALSRSIISYV